MYHLNRGLCNLSWLSVQSFHVSIFQLLCTGNIRQTTHQQKTSQEYLSRVRTPSHCELGPCCMEKEERDERMWNDSVLVFSVWPEPVSLACAHLVAGVDEGDTAHAHTSRSCTWYVSSHVTASFGLSHALMHELTLLLCEVHHASREIRKQWHPEPNTRPEMSYPRSYQCRHAVVRIIPLTSVHYLFYERVSGIVRFGYPEWCITSKRATLSLEKWTSQVLTADCNCKFFSPLMATTGQGKNFCPMAYLRAGLLLMISSI